MTLIHGDCLEVMAGLEPESFDAVVTDPPYDLTSTGARKGSPRNPGTGPYGRGFMGKAWDGTGIAFRRDTWAAAFRVAKPSAYLLAFGGTRTVHRMTVAIEDAGWVIRDMLVWAYASGFPKSKASLKPAWEPIVMARKPGPLRMLAIDECRLVVADDEPNKRTTPVKSKPGMFGVSGHDGMLQQGRWPANVNLTDPIFDGGIEGVVGGGEARGSVGSGPRPVAGKFGPMNDREYPDIGTYSRFFLIPKASRSERGTLNLHPTVKPLGLMRHLVRLVTPKGGAVLDPFLGSGTTALACESEGFDWTGIEREAEYVAIAEHRLAGIPPTLGLEAS